MADIKGTSVLKAVPWAAVLAILTALLDIVPPPYDVIVKILIVAIGGLAKVSPQTALVMTAPPGRANDPKGPLYQ